MKNRCLTFAMGMLAGAVLFGGGAAYAAGIIAEYAPQTAYVDGVAVQMEAYNIGGYNYVKLRDIGQMVGFNVYWQGGVQIDSDAPYTGVAPVQQVPSAESLRVSSYKGNTLQAGERSMLLIGPSGRSYTVASSNPAAVAVENVSGNWVAVAKAPGSAIITVKNQEGATAGITLTVTGAASIDLGANLDIRREMIRLINEVRRKNGVAELEVNEALMNAAQDCSAQNFTDHNTEYECKAGLRYGYPNGFGDNLAWFSGADYMENVAQTAVGNWVNSPGHFETMIRDCYDCIGVGVTINGQTAYCYMFAGGPNILNPYE